MLAAAYNITLDYVIYPTIVGVLAVVLNFVVKLIRRVEWSITQAWLPMIVIGPAGIGFAAGDMPPSRAIIHTRTMTDEGVGSTEVARINKVLELEPQTEPHQRLLPRWADMMILLGSIAMLLCGILCLIVRMIELYGPEIPKEEQTVLQKLVEQMKSFGEDYKAIKSAISTTLQLEFQQIRNDNGNRYSALMERLNGDMATIAMKLDGIDKKAILIAGPGTITSVGHDDAFLKPVASSDHIAFAPLGLDAPPSGTGNWKPYRGDLVKGCYYRAWNKDLGEFNAYFNSKGEWLTGHDYSQKVTVAYIRNES